ncbi:MAG: SDR family NAD(P)-dependent oxidoreductase [Zoogloeaceae bacterium]|nr:SDR family NAD(P)-dependent oxidoreductase [Zoogloeaceae bacterium]
MQTQKVAQKVAFVAGAMGGMGAAICQTLARDGLRVIAGYPPRFRFRDEWLALQRAAGFDFMSEEHEISDDSTLHSLLERISREIGPVEVLVNNAEMTRFSNLARFASERGTRVVSIEPCEGAYRTRVWYPELRTTH